MKLIFIQICFVHIRVPLCFLKLTSNYFKFFFEIPLKNWFSSKLMNKNCKNTFLKGHNLKKNIVKTVASLFNSHDFNLHTFRSCVEKGFSLNFVFHGLFWLLKVSWTAYNFIWQRKTHICVEFGIIYFGFGQARFRFSHPFSYATLCSQLWIKTKHCRPRHQKSWLSSKNPY
jgi:hypothetical protein